MSTFMKALNCAQYCMHNEGVFACSLLVCTKRATSFVLCSCILAGSVSVYNVDTLEYCCGLHLTHFFTCIAGTVSLYTGYVHIMYACYWNVVYIIFQNKTVICVGHGILTENPMIVLDVLGWLTAICQLCSCVDKLFFRRALLFLYMYIYLVSIREMLPLLILGYYIYKQWYSESLTYMDVVLHSRDHSRSLDNNLKHWVVQALYKAL